MNRPFYITDVFAEKPYAGNQLATLPNADDLSADEMQQIARAFNFAESTFIMSGGSVESGFDVRIFTPASELPFAGHPTLGTSYLIRNHLLREPLSELTLNLGVGPITVQFGNDDVLWMRQNEPEFGEVFDRADVADALGLRLEDVDGDYPCMQVSTGLQFTLVPLTSYEALQKAFVRSGFLANGCFVFCRGGYESEQGIRARMFAGELGVTEDPATGSANGCLAAWLSRNEYFGSTTVETRVGQGYEIARPSQLYLRCEQSDGRYRIDVGGRVNLVAEGNWLV